MNLEQFSNVFPCRLLCGTQLSDKPITGGYACDLLSWVISKIKTNDVWFTILNSINVVAVASLSDCACIMLTEDVDMDPQILEKARERSIVVFSTPLTTYEAAATLDRLLRKNQP